MILNISCLVLKQPNIKKVGDYFSGARDWHWIVLEEN